MYSITYAISTSLFVTLAIRQMYSITYANSTSLFVTSAIRISRVDVLLHLFCGPLTCSLLLQSGRCTPAISICGVGVPLRLFCFHRPAIWVSWVDVLCYLCYIHCLVGYFCSQCQSGRCTPSSVLCPLAYWLLVQPVSLG